MEPQPERAPGSDSPDPSDDPPSRQLSRRQLLTIAAVAFVIGLVASWIISRL